MNPNYKKIDLFQIINWLSKHETWVCNSKQVQSETVKAINLIKNSDIEEPIFNDFKDYAQLVEIAAYLRFDLFLRMFNEIGIKQDGFGGDTLMFCYDGLEEQEANQVIKAEMSVILQRIGLLIQAELVYKIFGDENRERVKAAIEVLKQKGELQ